MKDRRAWLDYVTSGALPYKKCEDIAEEVEQLGEHKWNILGGRLFARGGTTLHWGGVSFRFKQEDFELRTRTGRGLDWPLTYADLEPYYGDAEHFLQVAGDSSVADPPRSKSYPFEAAPFGLADGPVIEAMTTLGMGYQHVPVTRNTKPINGRPACQTVGTCKYCPVGARYSADQTLDDLVRHAQFELRVNSPVRRILLSSKRRVAGVEYVDTVTGREGRIEADSVIVCAGALEGAKLLLGTTSPEWPHGIGNDTGHVGRYLVAHPYFSVVGTRSDNPRRLQQELHFSTLCTRRYDSPAEQAQGKGIIQKSYSRPSLNLVTNMATGSSAAAIDAAAVGRHTYDIELTVEPVSEWENRVQPAAGITRYGLPRTRIEAPKPHFNVAAVRFYGEESRKILAKMGYTPQPMQPYDQRGDHAMCTCRMARSEADGVVGPDLKVFGTDNLYVCSNAVFSSPSAVNPTLTLVALAIRFAESAAL